MRVYRVTVLCLGSDTGSWTQHLLTNRSTAGLRDVFIGGGSGGAEEQD